MSSTWNARVQWWASANKALCASLSECRWITLYDSTERTTYARCRSLAFPFSNRKLNTATLKRCEFKVRQCIFNTRRTVREKKAISPPIQHLSCANVVVDCGKVNMVRKRRRHETMMTHNISEKICATLNWRPDASSFENVFAEKCNDKNCKLASYRIGCSFFSTFHWLWRICSTLFQHIHGPSSNETVLCEMCQTIVASAHSGRKNRREEQERNVCALRMVENGILNCRWTHSCSRFRRVQLRACVQDVTAEKQENVKSRFDWMSRFEERVCSELRLVSLFSNFRVRVKRSLLTSFSSPPPSLSSSSLSSSMRAHSIPLYLKYENIVSEFLCETLCSFWIFSIDDDAEPTYYKSNSN